MKKYFELSNQLSFADHLAGFGGKLDYADAMESLAEKMLESASETFVDEYEMARLYAFAGVAEQSLDWLEKAYESRNTQLVYSVAEPLFSLVWDHPRYAELRHKLNLPPRK